MYQEMMPGESPKIQVCCALLGGESMITSRGSWGRKGKLSEIWLCEKQAQESGLVTPQLTNYVLPQASFPLGEGRLLFFLRTWPPCSMSVCSSPYPSLQDVLESWEREVLLLRSANWPLSWSYHRKGCRYPSWMLILIAVLKKPLKLHNPSFHYKINITRLKYLYHDSGLFEKCIFLHVLTSKIIKKIALAWHKWKHSVTKWHFMNLNQSKYLPCFI